MKKKLRQRITLNDVSQAINSLKEQNLNPTADNILAEVIRQSNGTVGGSKGTVLKLKRQLDSTDNSTNLSTVNDTSTVQYSTNSSRIYGTKSVPISIDKTLLSILEVQLWDKLEARLDDKLREQFEVHQVNKYSPDEALQEMRELWLDSVARYTATQDQFDNLELEVQRLSKSEAQLSELKALALANQELKAQLEALQQLVQTKDEELEELSLENNELKLRLRPDHKDQQVLQTKDEEIARLQSTLDQTTNRIETQQNQFNQLSNSK